MLAARMYGYKQPLILEEVDKPEITGDEVLVRVEAAGMCRTDFQLIDGYFKDALNLAFPAIPGHEIAGRIDDVGANVTSWKEGQRAGVGWYGVYSTRRS